MRQDQKKSWDREYRLRGKLWRGRLKEGEIYEDNLLPGTTLDNGCGNGKGTPMVRGVIGLDFSKFALRLYEGENKVLGDIVHLPFKDGTFSNVLFVHSLDHMDRVERKQALAEAARVLKDSGVLLVRVFSRQDFRFGKGKETEDGTFLRGTKITTHYFDREEFFESSLFKVTKTVDINYEVKIQNNRFNRREFIIILVKCKSGNIQ